MTVSPDVDPGARPFALPLLDGSGVAVVLVCHDGARWLPQTLTALADQICAPGLVVAVDTGSTDDTPRLLGLSTTVTSTLTLERATAFGAAVHAGLERAAEQGSASPRWLWVLHDDSAPEPACLQALLAALDVSPSAGVVGPLCLDWDDPRVVVQAGQSTDASGQLQTGIGAGELDDEQFGPITEVLAVGSAGALVEVDTFRALGGFDPALPLFGEDLDLGWRVQRAGRSVLCVPAARLRHARAAARALRPLDALGDTLGAPLAQRASSVRLAQRAHGLRTFLANTSAASYRYGRLRLTVLAGLRALGFLLLRNPAAAGIEIAALRWALGPTSGLVAAREQRASTATTTPAVVRGLITSRTTRARNSVHAATTALARRQAREDLAAGPPVVAPAPAHPAVPGPPAVTGPPADRPPRRAPVTLPTGRDGGVGAPVRRPAGLRRPVRQIAVTPAVAPASGPAGASPPPRPTPFSRDPAVAAAQRQVADAAAAERDRDPGSVGERVVLVATGGSARVTRRALLSPLVLLTVALVAVSVLVHRSRLGLSLSGPALLPGPESATALLDDYLREWRPTGGGTAAPAPALQGLLGLLALPAGGGDHALALLVLAALPLAGASAYLATSSARLAPAHRVLLAAGWALLPVGVAGAADGRLDTVLTHVLLPLVLAGVARVLRGAPAAVAGGRSSTWLATAASTSLALAVIGTAAPVVHLLTVVLLLIGFVVVRGPSAPGAGLRRTMSLFAVVLLPVGLLLPWPAVVIAHPEVLLHGVGSPVPGADLGVLGLLTLGGGGAPPAAWTGAVVVLAAGVLAVRRPRRGMGVGLAVAALGGVVALLLASTSTEPLSGGEPLRGASGPAVLLLAAGVFLVLLVGLERTHPGPWRAPGAQALTAVAATAVLALGSAAAVLGSAGTLVDGPAEALPAGLAAELDATGARVLTAGTGTSPARVSGPRLATVGDDGLALVPGAAQRLRAWSSALQGTEADVGARAVAEAAVAGVGAIVLAPPSGPADRALVADLVGAGLVTDAGTTTSGRPVLRVELLAAGAVLLEPEPATAARSGGAAPTTGEGVTVVPGVPPQIAVRVSGGADGRLLVLAAEDEPGWEARVDGRPVAATRAYGHLVAVPLGGPATEVVLLRPGLLRSLLLMAQAAVLLCTLFVSIPPRRQVAPGLTRVRDQPSGGPPPSGASRSGSMSSTASPR